MKKVLLSYFVILIFTCSCNRNDSKCTGVICHNDGYCINGQCVCQDGYTGADCSRQITPTKIQITQIKVLRFPATKSNGAGWDLTSGPDIFPIFYKDNQKLWESPTYYEDADQRYYYEFNCAINLNNPNDRYTVSLYDYDQGTSDEFMGGITFTPYNTTNNFPTTIRLDAGGTVAFDLVVNYSW